MEKIFEQLEGEISREIDNLGTLSPGSDKYTEAVDSLTKLYKLRLEEIKLDSDNDDRDRRWIKEELKFDNDDEIKLKREQFEAESRYREEETSLKKDQIKEQNKDRIVRIVLETAGLLLPLAFYGIWMKKGFKFEESGTFTSTTFRNLFGKFRPTKN